MQFQKVTEEFKNKIIDIVSRQRVFDSSEQLKIVAKDHTEDFEFLPELLVKPANAEEISQIIKLANTHQIPVTPRGGGTGVSGGALAIHGGVVLSLERLNKIESIDLINRCATVESGVITQVFQEAVEANGMFFPPDPGSKGSCFLGGNLAESSGGPRSLRYGVTSDYVLNMEVVLPSGEIIWTGKNVTKNATGYDLSKLICGSEGTLGIITKIVFRLVDPPKHEVLLLFPFRKIDNVFDAVGKIAQAGLNPTSLEFVDARSLEVVHKYNRWTNHNDQTVAYLWMELEGESEALMMDRAAKASDLLENLMGGEAMIAQSPNEKEHLWFYRKKVGESIISYSVFKDIDTVVPVSKLGDLFEGMQQIEVQYGFRTAVFGHIGNGNLHIQILKESLSNAQWQTTVQEGVAQLFELVNRLGGSLSGEHGIGYLQKQFMPITVPAESLELMRQIKNVFDPNGILNPGKIF